MIKYNKFFILYEFYKNHLKIYTALFVKQRWLRFKTNYIRIQF